MLITMKNIKHACEDARNAFAEQFPDGATPEELLAWLRDKQNWLAWALSCLSPRIIAAMLDAGADVNAKDSYGRTPLYLAVWYNYKETAELLIERGADVNAKDSYGRTPLYLAAWHGQTQIVELLIEKGADVNAKNSFGLAPLYYTTWNGHTQTAELLRKHGGKE